MLQTELGNCEKSLPFPLSLIPSRRVLWSLCTRPWMRARLAYLRAQPELYVFSYSLLLKFLCLMILIMFKLACRHRCMHFFVMLCEGKFIFYQKITSISVIHQCLKNSNYWQLQARRTFKYQWRVLYEAKMWISWNIWSSLFERSQSVFESAYMYDLRAIKNQLSKRVWLRGHWCADCGVKWYLSSPYWIFM